MHPSPHHAVLDLLEVNEQKWKSQHWIGSGGGPLICRQPYAKCPNTFDDDYRLNKQKQNNTLLHIASNTYGKHNHQLIDIDDVEVNKEDIFVESQS